MGNCYAEKDSLLQSLPLPMPSLGIKFAATAADLARLAEDALQTTKTWTEKKREREITAEISIGKVGRIEFSTGRTAPVFAKSAGVNCATYQTSYTGDICSNCEGRKTRSKAGEILVFPNEGTVLQTSYYSGIAFCIENERLKRTGEIMFGGGVRLNPNRALSIRGSDTRLVGMIFSLFRHIDCIIDEGNRNLDTLSLDDQIYRTLNLILADLGGSPQSNARRSTRETREGLFDDLIDQIKENASNPISLTDLQEWSNYSARHLQNLFREKFDCTPMQFVRRQRLSTAMEKLQTADWDDTVTSIGRDCGYRFTSNFSSDFQREFGVAPSVVLRASRSPGHKV